MTAVMVILLSCASKKTVANTPATKPETTIEKLDETQLKQLVSKLERRDNNADGLLLLKGANYYVSNASKLSVEQMESFVELLQNSRKENDEIMELCKRATVSIDGGLKAAIDMYSKNPDKAVENLTTRQENDANYSLLIDTFKKQIEINKTKEYSMPDGDLVFYSHEVSGGMMRGTNYEIQKNSDGKTYLKTNANFRDMGDTTIVVPDTALVHIQNIFAEYKMYELAPLYVTPYMVFDAPSTHVSAKFSSGEYIRSDGQQSAPHNKGVWVIEDYLKSLLPTREK